MKLFIVLVTVLIVLASCNRHNTKIKERISNADSVAINYFKGDGTMDTVIAVKIVQDQKTISALSDLISASSTEVNIKCGYDGSLHFFKKNMVVQDIDFRMNETNCMLFTFKQEGALVATNLSPKAKQILESIMK